MSELEGVEKGEVCNRDGCKGIIEEREHELNGCTCFDNPPCSYCTENLAYCPECDWDSNEQEDSIYESQSDESIKLDLK